MPKLFIHATNVHQGGGKSLLDALIKTNSSPNRRVLLLDSRIELAEQEIDVGYVRRVEPSIMHRFLAEWWLNMHVHEDDTVLCFGNLPPLFRLAGHVIVFVQNKYLLEDVSLSGFSWRTKLRLNIERLWLRWRAVNVDEFIVQTSSMKLALQHRLDGKVACSKGDALHGSAGIPIKILPFANVVEGYQRELVKGQTSKLNDFDFLYVASGEPHKNHRRLIGAWCLLAKDGHFPSLCVTLDKTYFSELSELVELMKTRHGLSLDNLGVLPQDQIKLLYARVGALVYPSTFESFGLPLIEARQAGLPILASELDYVRDVLDPEQSFDPYSEISIARAIKRFMEIDELPLPLQNATEFINHIMEKTG